MVQTLYHDGRVSTFSESGASSSYPSDVSPLYTGDFSAMTKGAGVWCDPQYYTCELEGTEEVAGRSTVHVRVKHVASQGAPEEADPLDPTLRVGDRALAFGPRCGGRQDDVGELGGLGQE